MASLPHFVELDSLIDVERLKSLDTYLKDGIGRISERTHRSGLLPRAWRKLAGALQRSRGREPARVRRFYPSLPGLRLGPDTPEAHWWKTLYLNRPQEGYRRLPIAAACRKTEVWFELEKLVAFVETLPFEQFGRLFLIFSDEGYDEPIHRGPVPYMEYIWMRSNGDKRFFRYDTDTQTKHYVGSHAVWFDQRAWHGCDAPPRGELHFSIRVDGIFTSELREHIRGQLDHVSPETAQLMEIYSRLAESGGRLPFDEEMADETLAR